MIRLRFLHPGRHVWRLWRKRDPIVVEETWISPRRAHTNWERIFTSTLDLIWLPNTIQAESILLNNRHGLIMWHEGRWVTKIMIRLEGFSEAKQTLIAAALLKSARFQLL
jgi:hypothetical protein